MQVAFMYSGEFTEDDGELAKRMALVMQYAAQYFMNADVVGEDNHFISVYTDGRAAEAVRDGELYFTLPEGAKLVGYWSSGFTAMHFSEYIVQLKDGSLTSSEAL